MYLKGRYKKKANHSKQPASPLFLYREKKMENTTIYITEEESNCSILIPHLDLILLPLF